jgi:hypothetical protein
VRHGCATQEGRHEAHQANGARLLPFGAKDNRIELRAGEKGENDGAGAGEKPIHGALTPSASLPMSAPIRSCATVPTTISESAVEMPSHVARSVAARASASHVAARNQVLSISTPFSRRIDPYGIQESSARFARGSGGLHRRSVSSAEANRERLPSQSAARRRSLAKIDELQRQIHVAGADRLNGRLQVVALLP